MTNTRTAGEWNRRNRYLIHLKKLLKQLYLIEDKSSSDYKVLNAEIKGYLDAGLITRIASEKDLQKFIDLQRYGVGMPPAKATNTEAASTDHRKSIWGRFDEPAYRRMGPRATGRQLSHRMRVLNKES